MQWQVDAFQMGTNNIHFYTYVVGSHLNCTDAFQMGTNNICLYKEVDKWDTSCNLKNMELLDYVG